MIISRITRFFLQKRRLPFLSYFAQFIILKWLFNRTLEMLFHQDANRLLKFGHCFEMCSEYYSMLCNFNSQFNVRNICVQKISRISRMTPQFAKLNGREKNLWLIFANVELKSVNYTCFLESLKYFFSIHVVIWQNCESF